MNKDEQEKLLTLLKQKKNYLQKILDMTKERKFRVDEDDVERFYNFFQKREVLFENCRDIENKIKKFIVLDEDKNSFFYKDVEKVKAETNDIIKQIIFLDEKNKVIMKELLQLVKNNMRNLKVSQKMRQGYGDLFPFESFGSFDSKK